MLTYAIPLVPGPTRVPESVRRAYLTDYASGDLEPEYSQLYADVQEQLRTILNTRNQIALMTGEGMIALWGALRSCIRPGERVLAVSTGVFGHGIGEMAAAIGAEVHWVEFGYDEVNYAGYDALLPYRRALESHWYPYTPAWASLAALHEACRLVLDEGLEHVYARHAQVAAHCRKRALALGLSLYPVDEAACSPTVTALKVPEWLGWEELDRRLRTRGMGVSGSLGLLAGRVFRLGHMGSQADLALVERGMDVLAQALVG